MTSSNGPGKRAGSRRGKRAPRAMSPRLLLLALGITAALVAWGYLVYAAIDFGSSARGGRGVAWLFLALAAVGAVACLFVALVLVGRLLRTLGLTAPASGADGLDPTDSSAGTGRPVRPPGGRRAAR